MTQTERPTDKQLRNFGLMLGAIFAALFGALPLVRHRHSPLWPWMVALALWLGALLKPAALSYLYRGWTKLGFALGWINTRIILTVLFVVSVVPIGLVMRLVGRDRMGRRFETERESYRVPSKQRSEKSMEQPF